PGKRDPNKVHLAPNENLLPMPIEQELDEWFYIDKKAVGARETSLDPGDLQVVLNYFVIICTSSSHY
ncbi:hypothetical protein C8A00DRAFT_13692, partial [Chaetomidium leptoderma]